MAGREETSDSQWEQLKIVIKEAEGDRIKLQELKENNQELCKRYLQSLRQDLATPDECKSVRDIEKQLPEIQGDLDRIQRKASDRIVIEFVGATNSGKSTLINALAREECLPTECVETTMCLIEIHITNDEKWSVEVNGKALSDIMDMKHIKDLLSAMSGEEDSRNKWNINEESVVRVGWPKKFTTQLPENVVLVDSPGCGENKNCSQIVKNTCQQADIIVAVMDSMSPSKENVSKYYECDVCKDNNILMGECVSTPSVNSARHV